jgi:TIR domain
MADDSGKRVFVSYVREDTYEVDELCAVLEAAQIPYWRDRKDLGPGDAWRAKIQAAIRDGSLVFLACFSDNSRAKEKSYMNEELTVAVDEFRQMPPGRVWLIPVRFDAGDVPPWNLGAGRSLSDLNYADLFGKGHTAQAASLVTTISRLLGEKHPSPATALAAVEQATDAHRSSMLKQLTKDMLLDSSRRIELDDLVSQEVQRLLAVLKDQDRVAGPLNGSNEENIVSLAEAAQEMWRLTEPFCASLQVAGRWGEPDALLPWANGIKSFLTAAIKQGSGVDALLRLRYLPGTMSMMTATLACVASQNWKGLKVLVVDSSVRNRYEQKLSPIVDVTDPHQPFGGMTDWVTNALARSTVHGVDLLDALKHYTDNKDGKYYTPIAEWMHHELRPVFADQLPDDDQYDNAFDLAEVMLGVLAQDVTNVAKATDPEASGWGRAHWYGRATHRWRHRETSPIDDLLYELQTHGNQWGSLKAGLFGGDMDRARAALEAYGYEFKRLASQRF